jgi:RNA polymerase sigma-70 factor (ECF subfamily)
MMESRIGMASDRGILRASYKKPARFGELFDRHHKRFLAIAQRATSSKDEAEDIVAETFVRIYKHGQKFLAKKGGDFRPWSNTILRNCIIDQITKNRSKELSLTEEMESVIGDTCGYEAFESKNYIQSVFHKLSSAKAEILNLRFVLGKSFKEIAKILCITSGAARVRAYRAKKDFQEIYSRSNPNKYGA